MSVDAEALVAEIAGRVQEVAGVTAIVLGGSRARGTQTAGSDVDLGLYYDPDHPLDLAGLDRVAAELDDRHVTGLVTPIGGWGPWINGGGWLTVRGQPVDLIYRDRRRVGDVVEACSRGHVEVVYQPGHPHGFVSAIYMGEVALCRPLFDADGWLSSLKGKTSPYPPALKSALIGRCAWEIGFALETALKSVERTDTAYAAGSCFRAVMCLLQVLFALNGQYWLNEKGAVALAESFPLRPPRLRERIDDAFTMLAADREAIRAAIAVLDGLRRETAELLPAGATRGAGKGTTAR